MFSFASMKASAYVQVARVAALLLVVGELATQLAWAQGGRVLAWGDNFYGQGTIPAEATNVVAVSAGYRHSLALRADGTVIGWGQIAVPDNATNIVAMDAGYFYDMAVRSDGTVFGWGDNFYGQLNVPPSATNVVAISAGTGHNLALRGDGTVVAWGWNGFGQTAVPASARNVVAVAAGSDFSLALRADGSLVSWVTGGVPAATTGLVAIAAGYWSGVALLADGTVAGTSFSNAVAVAAGDSHALAFRADGSVVAWGQNTYGRIDVPLDATNVVAIAAGGDHSLAILGPVMSARLSIPYPAANGMAVTLPTRRGGRYLVERKSSLEESNWTAWQLIAGDGDTRQLIDPVSGAAQGFFRARQLP